MHTEKVIVDRGEAERLFHQYKTHAAYSEPIDWEVQRTYDLLRKGKVVIRALESIKQAGLNRDFIPKLALVSALAKECFLTRYRDGQITMAGVEPWKRARKGHRFNFREDTFNFPAESFPLSHDRVHR